MVLAQRFQLEGLIAKRPDSVYESGRRSGAWAKLKLTQQQEFVIGGYTPPEGSRKYFVLSEEAGDWLCGETCHSKSSKTF
jgi:ATP-dependent DNA ligase